MPANKSRYAALENIEEEVEGEEGRSMRDVGRSRSSDPGHEKTKVKSNRKRQILTFTQGQGPASGVKAYGMVNPNPSVEGMEDSDCWEKETANMEDVDHLDDFDFVPAMNQIRSPRRYLGIERDLPYTRGRRKR
ncbi:hypothetical protein K1719_009462 [Acacia pycnantha]|nr:hypothetical protein K1719_009462 [Acacia pycnantha]